MKRARVLLLLMLPAVLSCRDRVPDITGPDPVVHTLLRVSGDSLAGTVGQPHTQLTVRAEDRDGNPLADVPVRFFVPLGSNGTLDTSIVRTDAQGEATSGTWTLGTRSGVQLARAHAVDVAAVFTAFAAPDVPVALVDYAGNRQVTLAAQPVRVPPTVRVVDRFGNGVPGVPVQFSAQASSIGVVEPVSDSAGLVAATAWTPTAGTTTMSLAATSPTLPGAIASFEASVVDEMYRITFRPFNEPVPLRLTEALERAAARWSAVFSGHAGESHVTLPAGGCTIGAPQVSESITDVLVFVRVIPIDGAGEILASAAPCAYHEETGLPVVARISFDSSDLAAYIDLDWIDLIATHELGHALGFGTLWTTRNLLAGAGSSDPRFIGSAAAREYTGAFGFPAGTLVPVENTGGAGTAGRHWRASLFPTEVMNGFIASRAAPLSRITIAAMEDVGYPVRYAGADPYPLAVAAMGIRVEMRHESGAVAPPRHNRTMQMSRRVRR